MTDDILAVAREQVLDRGVGLTEAQTLEVLRLADDCVPDALELAHEVRMRWCGPEIEVEGIVSVKTGGCPEDCHFCSQSGRFETPVRAARLDIPSLVEAAKETAATGATEFCLVAAVRGPDDRLMAQVREGVKAIKAAVEINVACSLGILTRGQGEELRDLGVHRYNHNLETARSHFGEVVTTHTWEERWETLELVRELERIRNPRVFKPQDCERLRLVQANPALEHLRARDGQDVVGHAQPSDPGLRVEHIRRGAETRCRRDPPRLTPSPERAGVGPATGPAPGFQRLRSRHLGR